MATPPKNRIEVDLKLLSDKDTKLLKEIAGDLKTIINQKMVFGSVAQQMTSAAAVAGGVAGQSYLSQEYRSRHAQTDPGKHTRDIASNYDDVVAGRRENLQESLRRKAYSPGHENGGNEFLNLSRFGDFTTQDILKQISYGLGKFGFDKEKKDEFKNPLVTRQGFATASGLFGAAAHAYPAYRSTQKIAARIRSHMTGYTSLGLAAGQKTTGSGFLGTPFMSPGYRTGAVSSYENFKRSWGGLNPNYSGAQASDATNAAAAYGYDVGGDRGQFMIDQIGNLQRNLGLSGDQSASLLDPSLRFGTASTKNLADALIAMGRAAGQAGVNTQQLTLAAQQYGEQLAASFGGFASDRTLAAGGLGTIFQSPQTGGGIAASPVLQNLVVAQKGSYYKAAFSHTQQQDTMHALETFMSPFGGNFDQLGHTLKHGTAAQKDALMSNLIAAQQAGAIPGGMTATQFAQQLMRGRGNLYKSAQAGDLISRAKMTHHLSTTQLQTLEKDVVGKDWKNWDSDHAGQNKIDQLNTLFGQHQGKANSRAASRVRISLDPTAAKYLKASIDSQEGKNAHSNSDSIVGAASSAMDGMSHDWNNMTRWL